MVQSLIIVGRSAFWVLPTLAPFPEADVKVKLKREIPGVFINKIY